MNYCNLPTCCHLNSLSGWFGVFFLNWEIFLGLGNRGREDVWCLKDPHPQNLQYGGETYPIPLTNPSQVPAAKVSTFAPQDFSHGFASMLGQSATWIEWIIKQAILWMMWITLTRILLVGGLDLFYFPIYWEKSSQLTNSYFSGG